MHGPVAYFTSNQAVEGDKYRANHDGAIYHFVSESNSATRIWIGIENLSVLDVNKEE